MKKRTLKQALSCILCLMLLLSFVANHSLVFATVGDDAAAAAVPIEAQTNGNQDMTASIPVTNEELTEEPLAPQTVNQTIYPNGHEYTPGIIDGGIYSLRNVSTGQYLAVQYGTSLEFSPLITRSSGYSRETFKFEYLGAGLYRFAPTQAPQYYAVISWDEPGYGMETHSFYQEWGEFKIQHVGDGMYRLYAKVTDFQTVICSLGGDSVSHENVNEVAEYYLQTDLWTFECQSSVIYDAYEKMEIRHTATGKYLNVWQEYTTEGSLIYATQYHTTENEQFKMRATGNAGEYYFVPTHRTTTYMTATENLSISHSFNLSTQGFLLQQMGVDARGYPQYLISIVINGVRKYMNIGTQVPEHIIEYYVVFGDDATQYWSFEKVGFDHYDMRRVDINQAYQKTIWEVDEAPVYVMVNTLKDYNVKYRITVTSWDDVRIDLYRDANWTIPPYYELVEIRNNNYVLDVMLEPGVPYYCYIYNLDSRAVNYQLKIMPFVASYHSYTEDNLSDSYHKPIVHAINAMKNIGWLNNDREDQTTGEAHTDTNVLGQRDFNSDLFMYTSHGAPGYITYDELPFHSSDLPDMSNCELAVWLNCESALADPALELNSMAQQSILNGACAAIGWATTIDSDEANTFAQYYFWNLSQGETVYVAAQHTITQITNYPKVDDIISAIQFFGNQNLVLHYVPPSPEPLALAMTAVTPAFDKSEYTLMVENDSIGVKLYCKLVNGITTDDYYIECYKDGKLTDVKKSDYTFTAADVSAMTAQANSILASNTSVNAENLHYSYTDNGWHLVEKRVTAHEGDVCACQHEVTYYDWTVNQPVVETH